MQFGGFLDTMPSWLFASAHVIFLVIGLWVAKKVMDAKVPYAKAFWLYPIGQLGFLAFFLGGLITLKMAVLLEQTLIVIMIVWIALKVKR